MPKVNKKAIILGIDTSCDDTAIAIIKQENGSFKLLSNVVSSQVKLHSKYGGVYPSLAKREHQKNLAPVFIKALKQKKLLKIQNKLKVQSASWRTKLKTLEKILNRDKILKNNTIKFLQKYEKPKIDYIAVTVGPGLEPCLWQGINFAKALSYFWNILIILVNHIEGHLIANFLPKIVKNLQSYNPDQKKLFPAIGLVVSGGHTELVILEKMGKYKIIGQTLDDAAGECLDKTARILGLGYPGGPAISASAEIAKNSKLEIKNYKINLPRPMLNSKNYNFSFSGLKTAVLYLHQKQTAQTKQSKMYTQQMAKEIQQAIIDVLIKKTIKASENYGAKTIILGGGVIANQELRKQFKERAMKENLNLLLPEREFCTDNAAMIASCSWYNVKKAKPYKNIKAQANLNIG